MWAAAVTDVGRDRSWTRSSKSMGLVAKGDRQSRERCDPTESKGAWVECAVWRRFKSLCDLEIEASRIAGTDLWASEAPEPYRALHLLHEQVD